MLLAFVRLSTHPQVFARPLPADRALDIVARWLGQPCAVVVHPGDRHAAGNLVNDAHLAALAIEHGAELNSCDADFSRFSGLRWINPLDAS